MSKLTFTAKLLERLPKGSEIVPQRGAAVAVRLCCSHGHAITETFPQRFPPDFINKKLIERGWVLTNRHATCPEHAVKSQEEPVATAPTETAPQVDRSEAAKRAKRLVYMTLEEAYDDVNKTYRKDWTDKKVAELCDTSVEFVQRTREEDFGPLSLPPELQGLSEQIADAQERIKRMRSEFEVITQNLDQSVSNMTAKITSLQAEFKQAARRMGLTL